MPPVDEPADAELVAVGRIGKAHGLRGEVAVEAWSDDPGGRFTVGVVLRAQQTGAPLVIEAARLHGDRWLISFAGVIDRTAAEALRATVLVMPARERPAIEDPDEYYDSDLVGLLALDPVGTPLGTVTEILHSASGIHLVLAQQIGDEAVREHLVPFVASIVPAVDIAAGTVTVDAPAGLFDL